MHRLVISSSPSSELFKLETFYSDFEKLLPILNERSHNVDDWADD
jgi:hypothetical protein